MRPKTVFEVTYYWLVDELLKLVLYRNPNIYWPEFEKVLVDAGYCIDAPEALPAGSCAFGVYEWDRHEVLTEEPSPLQTLTARDQCQ